MEAWRFLNSEFADPYMNIAVEEAILIAVNEKLSPNTIRFWRNSNSVVVGRNQSIEKVVNLNACKKLGVTIVRRFTGGGTVYQDHGNLNWSIFLCRSSPISPIIISDVFKIFGKAVARGLKILGINANFQPPNMIQSNGKKISGLAAYAKPNAILCHGTLLISTNLDTLSEVLPLHKKTVTEVTSLERELKRQVPLSLVKTAILQGLKEFCEIKAKLGSLSEIEMKKAKVLYDEKYGGSKWNFKY
ncbi:lipoate--protein ligase family protein [Candidatus Bathyarchaeota archaeon]|nr:lipoate--protein ligase family protein [Candidatus Bathyarchaeota archaeon]